MKNVMVLLVFVLILAEWQIKADALLFQEPIGFYSQPTLILNRFMGISPHGQIKVGVKRETYVEDSGPVGATIFIQSIPMEFLKK